MATITDTFTGIPVSYDSTNSTYKGVYNSNNPENGLSDQNSSTRACVYANTGSNAVSKLVYNFDCSSIPQNATITSVSCIAAGSTYSGSTYFTTRVFQLYNGNTAKGTATTITGNGSTKATHNINGGSWTRSELDNIKIVEYVQRGTSQTSTQASFSFWGATLTVEYTYETVTYNVTSTLATDKVDSIDPEGVTEVSQGGSYTLNIYGSSISGVTVEDNGTDVTSQLVQKEKSNTRSTSTVLGTYTLISGSFNGSGASYFQGLVGNGVDASKTTSNYYSGGSGTIAVFTYNMNFTLPSNAIITRVYCEVNGHAESTSNSNEYMCVQLRSGDTELTDELNFKSVGTSNSTQTLEPETLPTVSQLSNLVLYCRLGYYGGAINGATCYVEYHLPTDTPTVYYTYELNNITEDHIIQISESGPFIPPEEDPTKTYYPITISSINATTTPGRGTVRLEAGTNQTITIEPSETQVTLILDNGVDVSDQLVSHSSGTPSYNIGSVSGASYGFALNNDGYYESQNQGRSQSVAVTKVNLNLPVRCLVTFTYINYAEATYDYGMFGNIDVELDTANHEEGANGENNSTNLKLLLSSASDNSANERTLTYEVPAGQHFIEAKFTKDQYTNDGNDSLQFKVSIEALEPLNTYTYTLTNIQQGHNLIFVFGNVTYYFVTSSGDNVKLYPNGQYVVLDQGDYKLTIIPDSIGATITVTDNNVDVTSQLITESYEDKSGNTVTNYIYNLNTVSANHTINVTSSSGGLYLKISGNWIKAQKIYRKESGAWREVNLESLTEPSVYIYKNT